MSTPDIAQVPDQERAEHRDDADDDGRDSEARGPLANDFRVVRADTKNRVHTEEHEADAEQRAADSDRGLVPVNVKAHDKRVF